MPVTPKSLYLMLVSDFVLAQRLFKLSHLSSATGILFIYSMKETSQIFPNPCDSLILNEEKKDWGKKSQLFQYY